MHSYKVNFTLRRLLRSNSKISFKPSTTQTRTMAFFPRTFYHPTEASFTPLFRLLDDFDSYSRQNGRSCNVRRQATPSWQPRFDVRETAEAYELHGELPGISKENVHIEFSDSQTLVVRGKVERSYTTGTQSNEQQLEDTFPPETITEKEEPKRKNSFQATVEDEDVASEHESGFEVITTEEKTSPKQKTVENIQEKAPAKQVDKAKYWLSERSVGEFARSFHFASLVEHDAVTASFKDGVLSIAVPKSKKLEATRIAIN